MGDDVALGKLDADNPFNCGLRCTDIDPIYAVTAEDADQNSFTFLPHMRKQSCTMNIVRF